MNAMTMIGTLPGEVGLRDRIVSGIRAVEDRQTKSLLRDILKHLDKPYDLTWMQEEFRLSPAEFKVLGMLAEGKTSESICTITGTARSTVRKQIHDIYKKARVTNMAELTALLLTRARNP